MQKGIIDRFEGSLAVIEMDDDQMTLVAVHRLPEKASIGDQLLFQEDGTILLDVSGTKARRQEIDALADNLFEED